MPDAILVKDLCKYCVLSGVGTEAAQRSAEADVWLEASCATAPSSCLRVRSHAALQDGAILSGVSS